MLKLFSLTLFGVLTSCLCIVPIPFPFPNPSGKVWQRSVVHASWSNRAIKVYDGFADKEILDSSRFLPDLNTVLIISGSYADNSNYQSIYHGSLLFPTLLMNTSCLANYLSLDWGQLWTEYIFPNDTALPYEYDRMRAPDSIYCQLALRIPEAAAFAARALYFMNEIGYLSGNRLHIIGHSFGAHLAGQIAVHYEKLTKGDRVARVTGLDPTGVLDQWPPGAGPQLSQRDAEYVDVYYTNLQVFGMKGWLDVHMSYIVNDGRSHQHCEEDGVSGWKQVCNHYYAGPVFVEASRPDNPVRACSCVQHQFPFDANEFEACSKHCTDPVTAGIHSERPIGFRSIFLPLAASIVTACLNPRYARGDQNFMFLIQCYH